MALVLGLGGRWLLDATLGTIFFAYFSAMLLSIVDGATIKSGIARALLILLAILPAVAGIGPLSQTAQFLLLTLFCSLFLMSLCVLLRHAHVPASLADTLVCLGWLMWLGWPMYLARAWTGAKIGGLLDRLVFFHPLLVINGIYPELGDWSHRPVAYASLLNLGQDVPFALPASSWPLVTAQIGGFIIIAMIVIWIDRHRTAAAGGGEDE